MPPAASARCWSWTRLPGPEGGYAGVLRGGGAQRPKLTSEMSRAQDGTLFVFDEPTVGLHQRDVRTFPGLQRLLDDGAIIVVIEHDLDLISNANHVINIGPGGEESEGGSFPRHGGPCCIKRRQCHGPLSEGAPVRKLFPLNTHERMEGPWRNSHPRSSSR